MRAYVVLAEVPGDSTLGDLLFVYLGTYEARDPRGARRAARAEHDLPATNELVTVAAKMWLADEDG